MTQATLPMQKNLPAHKHISVLGATGTIGQNTLSLIAENPSQYTVHALTSQSRVAELAEAAKASRAKLAVIGDESLYAELKTRLQGTGIEAAAGKQAINDAAARPADMVVSGIVGAAALEPTLAAIRKGTSIGLANKECLVCAGDLMMDEAKRHNAALIPIDSEHNAVFQTFDFNQPKAIERVTLTASGGPFRNFSREQMQHVTPEQAVNHPNWTMGAKISVDSASMMNKGLEIIEAYYLFPVEKQQIDAIIHPESIVHCLVSYYDGSMLAGLSIPDMRVPIAYALGWPNRIPTATKRMNLAEIGKLTFEQPDETKFPCLRIAREALNTGGTATCILNAANEIAVAAFLQKKISFLAIADVVEAALAAIPAEALSSLEQIAEVDAQARKIAAKFCHQ
jgi:1-deoxy-D-xylulose-5-phosphate reductoisomerase